MSDDAPLVPCAGIAAFDEAGRLVLVQRADDGTWCLPGGQLDFGESFTDGACREFREETGHDVEITGLLGIYSDPITRVHRYADGRLAQLVGVVFEARIGARRGGGDAEVAGLGRFRADELPDALMASDALAIRDACSDGPRPFIA